MEGVSLQWISCKSYLCVFIGWYGKNNNPFITLVGETILAFCGSTRVILCKVDKECKLGLLYQQDLPHLLKHQSLHKIKEAASLMAILKAFMNESKTFSSETKAHTQNQGVSMKNLEVQMH